MRIFGLYYFWLGQIWLNKEERDSAVWVSKVQALDEDALKLKKLKPGMSRHHSVNPKPTPWTLNPLREP